MTAIHLYDKVLIYERQGAPQEHFYHRLILAYSRCTRVPVQYKAKTIFTLNKGH